MARRNTARWRSGASGRRESPRARPAGSAPWYTAPAAAPTAGRCRNGAESRRRLP